ncbi:MULTISPECIES: hypothetical protein [Bizionia]|uniref:Lipoprotein n=1 Tax=Bizionia algoritergicola TaxID=291187 RepID=A0A5D0QSC7_9FLAO|nr:MULTISPECIES: hypothetical protein [Bizionia]OBX21610.1 hypothetical protein BAA08_11985 [Bizionia sp. APA-3]TYB72057.1 hypothetical protein ES675_12895 [Bizionia algoritergicola]
MKYSFLFGLVFILSISCDKLEKPVHQKLVKVKTCETLIKNYRNKSHERNLLADSSEISNAKEDDVVKKDKAMVSMIRYYYDMSNVMKNTSWAFKSRKKK